METYGGVKCPIPNVNVNVNDIVTKNRNGNGNTNALVSGHHYTADQLRELGFYNVLTGDPEKDFYVKKSKYRNKPVRIDGIRFDSTKEGNRYSQLKLMQKSGIISDLQCQVGFTFMVNGSLLHTPTGRPYRYIADFVYHAEGIRIVEDVKGVKTREYKTKKMLMDHVNHISIVET